MAIFRSALVVHAFLSESRSALLARPCGALRHATRGSEPCGQRGAMYLGVFTLFISFVAQTNIFRTRPSALPFEPRGHVHEAFRFKRNSI